MSDENISKLARRLGIPLERIDLLREALTHRTYAVEHKLGYDNQRLEFLGDAVLEIIHTEFLFHRYPDMPEGDLTKIRSALACEKTLAGLAKKLDLGVYILIGNGEKGSRGYARESTLCDLFEAVLGALYLTCGMERTKNFVHKLFGKEFSDPKQLLKSLNPKGRLQEFSQGRWHETPEYVLLCSGGPQHLPFFEVEVRAGGFCALGTGCSRKSAETAAAVKLLGYFSRRFNGGSVSAMG